MFQNLTRTATGMIIIAGAIVAVALWFIVFWGIGLAIAALTGIIALSSYRNDVTVDPPRIARRKINGKLVEEEALPPGIYFALSLNGFFEDLVLIEMTPTVRAEETELVFRGVRCKAQEDEVPAGATPPTPTPKRTKESGASVEVHIGFTIMPDKDRTTDYIKSGKITQIMKTLSNMLGTAVREQGADRTWEEYVFGKSRLAMELIIKLTGIQPTEKVVFQSDKPVLDTDPSRPHHRYQVRSRTGDEDLVEEDIQLFLDTVLVDNPPDVHGLGIRIPRLNVTEIQPEDPDLKADSNRKAREKTQFAAEEIDFGSERKYADSYIKWGKEQMPPQEVSVREALEWVRVNRGRAKELFFRIPPGASAGAFAGFGRDALNREDGGEQDHAH